MAASRFWYDKRVVFSSVLLVITAIVLFTLTRRFEFGRSPDSLSKSEVVTELPIPETPWGQNAPEVQKHVEEFRERLEHAKSSADAAPMALTNAYGQLGEIYLAYDLPIGAIACFRNAASLDSTNFRWPYLQAMAHFAAVETQLAYDSMNEALRQLEWDYSAGPEHHLAARCFLGEAAMRLNKMDKARLHFDEAIRLNPNSFFAHFRRGQLASRTGHSELAVQDFLDTLKLYSESGVVPPPVCLAVAAEYQKLGRNEEAERYRGLAKSGPQDFVVSYSNPLMSQVSSLNRSSAYLRRAAELELARGNYQEALDKIAVGLEGSPDSLKLRMLRVEILMQLEQTDEAIVELCEIRRLDVNGSGGRAELCELYASSPITRQKSLEEALRWQMDQPGELKPLLTLAAVYFQLKQYQEARDILTNVANRLPKELSPQLGVVTAVCALGDYQTAVTLYQKLMVTFPENAELRHHYARFLVTCPTDALRDSAEALKILRELSAAESSFGLEETLACALAESGQMPEARQLLSGISDRLGQSGRPSLRRRLAILQRSFQANQPWREKWPFAVIEDSRVNNVL